MKKRKRQKVSTWLETRTGKTDLYWLRRIGNLIGKHAYHDDKISKTHDCAEIQDWFSELSKEVERRVTERIDIKRADENMAFASVMSYILMNWWVRLVRAKCYDPRRPLKYRKIGMGRLSSFCSQVMGFMTDESKDHKHFPKQKWDAPFAPGAKNGKYV